MTKKNKNDDDNIFIELEGSHELAQYFLGPNYSKKAGQHSKKDDSFSLLTFFENDQLKLNKLTNLFSHKIENAHRYKQLNSLIINQEELLKNNMEEFNQKNIRKDSILHQNLAEIFNKNFN